MKTGIEKSIALLQENGLADSVILCIVLFVI